MLLPTALLCIARGLWLSRRKQFASRRGLVGLSLSLSFSLSVFLSLGDTPPLPPVASFPSVVFGGFAATELANRINAASPKCIITASCGLLGGGRALEYKPIVEAAISQATSKPEFCVVLQV